MGNAVENSQIDEFIANLKGRRAYEEKKASKLGFSILKTMWLIKSQISCLFLQVFVRRLSSEYGVIIKLRQSLLVLVVAVDLIKLILIKSKW